MDPAGLRALKRQECKSLSCNATEQVCEDFGSSLRSIHGAALRCADFKDPTYPNEIKRYLRCTFRKPPCFALNGSKPRESCVASGTETEMDDSFQNLQKPNGSI